MSGSSVQTVTRVARNGHPQVGAVLARAFHDDPLWTAVFPEPRQRRLRLPEMFTALSKATAAASGLVEVTGRTQAAAVWLPPGIDIGLWAMARSGFGLARFTMRVPAHERKLMLAIHRQFDEARAAHMPEPHWYLSAVGVDPDRQGRGLGSTLLRVGIARADATRTPIYLETETPANVSFYQGLGFEVIEETSASGLDVPIWLMLRHEPGAR